MQEATGESPVDESQGDVFVFTLSHWDEYVQNSEFWEADARFNVHLSQEWNWDVMCAQFRILCNGPDLAYILHGASGVETWHQIRYAFGYYSDLHCVELSDYFWSIYRHGC